MTYPYGTKGAPVVGNGLGGLPRRAVAAAATAVVSRPRYDVNSIATFSINNMPSNASAYSPLILMGGKGLIYLTNAGTIYRFTFNYSDAGITGASSGVTAASYGLPQLSSSSNNGVNTFCWRHTISATQTLFKFTGMRPFLVTWDGTNDSTFVQVPSSLGGGTFSNGGTYTSLQPLVNCDALLLPSGNLIMFSQVDGGSTIALIEYTNQLTFVRAMSLASIGSGDSSMRVLCRKMPYGYVVAIASNSGTTTQNQGVMTLNPAADAVISFSINRSIVSADGSTPPYVFSINAGLDGVVFYYDCLVSSSYFFASKAFKVSSSGVVTTAHTNSNFISLSSAGNTAGRRYVAGYVGRFPDYAGCTKTGEYSSPLFFKPASGGQPNDGPVLTINPNSFATSWDGVYTYLDADYTPFINSSGTALNGTIYPIEVTKSIVGVYTAIETNSTFGLAASEDDNGFIVVSGSSSNNTNRLLKKVYR